MSLWTKKIINCKSADRKRENSLHVTFLGKPNVTHFCTVKYLRKTCNFSVHRTENKIECLTARPATAELKTLAQPINKHQQGSTPHTHSAHVQFWINELHSKQEKCVVSKYQKFTYFINLKIMFKKCKLPFCCKFFYFFRGKRAPVLLIQSFKSIKNLEICKLHQSQIDDKNGHLPVKEILPQYKLHRPTLFSCNSHSFPCSHGWCYIEPALEVSMMTPWPCKNLGGCTLLTVSVFWPMIVLSQPRTVSAKINRCLKFTQNVTMKTLGTCVQDWCQYYVAFDANWTWLLFKILGLLFHGQSERNFKLQSSNLSTDINLLVVSSLWFLRAGQICSFLVITHWTFRWTFSRCFICLHWVIQH